jgi:hypothetical protein
MGCFNELYLPFDKASLYLKEAGVTPHEINQLKFQMVSGALRIPIAIYRFADLETLARSYGRPDALPDIDKFITKYQRSRHCEKKAGRQRRYKAASILQNYLIDRTIIDEAYCRYYQRLESEEDNDID